MSHMMFIEYLYANSWHLMSMVRYFLLCTPVSINSLVGFEKVSIDEIGDDKAAREAFSVYVSTEKV